MKTPDVVTKDIERRLNRFWSTAVAGDHSSFPHSFPIGAPDAAKLKTNYAAVYELTVIWREWAADNHVKLTVASRKAQGGTTQQVPTHVEVQSIEQAAAIVGGPWLARINRGRKRLALLNEEFGPTSNLSALIRMIDAYEDIDIEILTEVTHWFKASPQRAHGLTPRQVPIPGIHGKWLENHLPAVRLLSGIEEFNLLPAHPHRIHFSYLDPTHRRKGGRVHDSATVGDSFLPVYQPKVVVISENKDTAIHFPELAGGISIEGQGNNADLLANFDWITYAPVLVYWGDMDAAGMEILNRYRTSFNRDIDSIFMDMDAYRRFEPYGTHHAKNGQLLKPQAPGDVRLLHPAERTLYDILIAGDTTTHRRIEQERIPLHDALHEVYRVISER